MKLNVKGSPHIRAKTTTARLMWDVVIALLPALAAGVFVHGWRALVVVAVCIAACQLTEALWLAVRNRRVGGSGGLWGGWISDGSAAVTGMLLGMTLPASVPYWLAAAGGIFAALLVKGMSGGLGQNCFNPALAARAFLLLVWPVHLVRYPKPGTDLGLGATVDFVSSATPLHEMQIPALPVESLWRMFLGNIGGSIGETSALALLLGFWYLWKRRVITPHITLSYLGTFAALAFLFFKVENRLLWTAYEVLGGGLLLGAVFMATDYATSPVTPRGRVWYGAGCGVLTLLFRYLGLFPEGVTYAVLLMNGLSWRIDELTPPLVFGHGMKKSGDPSTAAPAATETEVRKAIPATARAVVRNASVAVAVAALLFALNASTRELAVKRGREEALATMRQLLPGSGSFTEEPYDGDDGRITSVFRGENGCVVETEVDGYAGTIVVWTGVGDDGRVKGVAIRDLKETAGLGFEAARNRAFLEQFLHTGGEASIGVNVDALTGATVTSRSVMRAVNAAVAYASGADVMTAPTKWSG